MISKRQLIVELNQTNKVEPIFNSQDIEIRRFAIWPKNLAFDQFDYDILDIIIENTAPQKEITFTDLKIGNFEILECLQDNTCKIRTFDYCLDLYKRFKDI